MNAPCNIDDIDGIAGDSTMESPSAPRWRTRRSAGAVAHGIESRLRTTLWITLIPELACVDAVFEMPRSARHLEHGVFPTDLSSGHDISSWSTQASLGREQRGALVPLHGGGTPYPMASDRFSSNGRSSVDLVNGVSNIAMSESGDVVASAEAEWR